DHHTMGFGGSVHLVKILTIKPAFTHFTTRRADSAGVNDCLKASITAIGFLRWKRLWKLKTKRKTKSSSEISNLPRPSLREPRILGSRMKGICTTGTGETGDTAEAINDVGAQISS